MHRVLKKEESIYLHVDDNAVHYLKMVMDEIFGIDFQNQITWLRSDPKNGQLKQFGRFGYDPLLQQGKNGLLISSTPRYLSYAERFIDLPMKMADAIEKPISGTRRPEGTRPSTATPLKALHTKPQQRVGAAHTKTCAS